MAERGQHHLAVLSGAYVSLADLSIMKRDPELASCPHCGNVGTKAHAWWECLGRPHAERGIAFRSNAQQFLAWPTGDREHDDGVLEAVVAVRKLTWASGITMPLVRSVFGLAALLRFALFAGLCAF